MLLKIMKIEMCMNYFSRGVQKMILVISGVVVCALLAIMCVIYIIVGVLLEVTDNILVKLERKT